MYEPNDAQKELTSALDGIESQLEKSLATQKESIEKALLEQVNRQKEEAQRKIDATEREFADGRRRLEEHKAVLAEIKTAKEQIQGQIRTYVERALSNQRMLERMSSQALEEYDKISHLSLELDGLRQRAEEETEALKKHLAEKYGVRAQFRMTFETPGLPADLRQEIVKMKKIQEILGAGGSRSAPPVEPEVENFREEAQPVEVELAPAAEAEPEAEPVSQPAPASAAPAAEPAEQEGYSEEPDWTPTPDDVEELEVQTIMESLARYRKTEPVLNGTEIAYYKKDKKMVLDGDAFVATVGKISDVAKGLHVNLGQKELSKDMFLIKQEILNQQEILRKTFLRVVRFCEKEDGALPQYISDVLSARMMKDILERLTFGNWSNPADFAAFVEYVTNLKNSFRSRTNPPRPYLRSLLDQVEGRLITGPQN